MIVQGAEGLAKVVGVKRLAPTAATIERLIQAVVRDNVELDAVAAKAFGSLVAEYVDLAPRAADTISGMFAKHVAEVDGAAQVRLLDLMAQLAEMPVSDDVRDRLLERAQEIDGAIRTEDHATFGTIAKIAVATVGGILVIAAGAAGVKFAREPTFLESVFGKK